MEKGAKFNYSANSNFINEIDLNAENIEYIFSNNYWVNTEKEYNEILKRIISMYHKRSGNNILKTYLNCSLIKEKKIKIDDSIYKSVINDENMEALTLLYEYDYRDKDIVSTIIYNENYDMEEIIDYLEEIYFNVPTKLISKL